MALPKISSQQQLDVEVILAKWTGKLTWEALVDRVFLELGLKVSRQTLCTYAAIDAAFKDRKMSLRGRSTGALAVGSTCDATVLINKLNAEITVLKRNNAEQLRMIERMLSNASAIPNIDLHILLKKRPEEM